MNLTRDRLHTIAWALVVVISLMLAMVLVFRVNAIKSEIKRTEQKIAALQAERDFLETEYQTRVSQSALASINDVGFGYKAPIVGQYIHDGVQLAAYGGVKAPVYANKAATIQVARAEVATQPAVRLAATPAARVTPQSDRVNPATLRPVPVRSAQVAVAANQTKNSVHAATPARLAVNTPVAGAVQPVAQKQGQKQETQSRSVARIAQLASAIKGQAELIPPAAARPAVSGSAHRDDFSLRFARAEMPGDRHRGRGFPE